MAKKVLATITAIILLFALSACKVEGGDIIDIPSYANDPLVSASDDTDNADETSERDQHINLGMTVIESIEDLGSYYDLSTYEGLAQLVTDYAYRTKLDIEYIRKKDNCESLYAEYYELLVSYLEDNKPKCLIPQDETAKMGTVGNGWKNHIMSMASLDEQSLTENEKLVGIFAYHCFTDAKGTADIPKRLQKYPLLSAKLLGEKPVITGQRFDSERSITVLDAQAPEGFDIVYLCGKGRMRITDNNYFVISSEEDIELLPNYSGTVTVACRGKYGLIGESVEFKVSDMSDKIPANEVKFSSARLDGAVRAFLGKSAGDAITQKDLIDVKDIYINGDGVYINRKGLTVEAMNATAKATVNDFVFSDIEYFPCLTYLTVKNNDISDPSGKRIRYIEWLEITNCGIKDISALEGTQARIISLVDNEITDASVLASAARASTIIINGNPLRKISLPEISFIKISIDNTEISSLDFLSSAVEISSFSCIGTNVKDIGILASFDDIKSLYIPEGIDYGITSRMSSLDEFYVGDKKIK